MDLHTLHIEHAVLLGLFTLLTVANSMLHRGTRGVLWFPVYTFYAFVGAVLIALRGSIPNSISIFFGAVFFPLAYVFLHRSLTEFFERRSYQWRVQLLLVALSGAALLRWGVVAPNTGLRLFWYSVALGVQLGLTGVFVLRSAGGALRWSGRMMGGLVMLLSMNNFGRAIEEVLHGAPANYLQSGTAYAWSLLATTVLQGAITVAFVWMTAARLRQDLEVEATTDPLTRLLNRRAIEVAAEREILLSRQSGLPVSAILIDLDEFKQINDVWGHQCGDAVLASVALCLQGQMRSGDHLGRLGGDEFVVLLPETPRGEAMAHAERLRSELEELRCVAGEMEATVRASFGVAELQGLGYGWEQLMLRCDKALYEVKGMGGNRTLVH